MTPDERERMYELCRKIQTEQDQKILTALAEELNRLLERKSPIEPSISDVVLE